MKVTFILALAVASFMVACGESEAEPSENSVASSVAATPDPVTPESTTEVTVTSDPENTPTSTPAHFQDPSEQDIEDAHGIYEVLPKPLPANERFEILYDPVPGPGGVFTISVIGIELGDEETYKVVVEEALQWFRSSGFEPCDAPLAAVIAITGFYWDGPPPDDHIVWEPCK